MKKLLSLLFIVLMAFLFIGCEKEDEELVFRDQTYEDLEEIFNFFETPSYEDLEFGDEDDMGTMQGTSNVLMYDIESINTIVIENNVAINLSIYLTEDTNRHEMIISGIDIIYVDIDNETYIELWFYKDNLLDISENLTLDRNVLDFNRGLRRFTIDDYQELLYEIGYREVKNQT